MKPSPRLYLAASPTTAASIPTIFRSGDARLLIENPPFTRHNGFNLVTYEQGRIDKGEKLTVGGDRKRLDLYPDGTFIAYATFADFLGWPRDEAQFAQRPKINSLALIEFTYDFVQAYERILGHVVPLPEQIPQRSACVTLTSTISGCFSLHTGSDRSGSCIETVLPHPTPRLSDRLRLMFVKKSHTSTSARLRFNYLSRSTTGSG
jgi:hypothetical protein